MDINKRSKREWEMEQRNSRRRKTKMRRRNQKMNFRWGTREKYELFTHHASKT
jgi:hypothetical protein